MWECESVRMWKMKAVSADDRKVRPLGECEGCESVRMWEMRAVSIEGQTAGRM